MVVKFVLGDITEASTDAIVNAANVRLLAGSGVCGAIFRAAGYELLQAECDKLAPIQTGDAVITSGYNLKAKYIIHTAGPIYKAKTDAIYLRNSYYNCLLTAYNNELESISFPSISTGIYGYPVEEAAKVAIDTIFEFYNDYPENTVKEIYFYLFDNHTYDVYLNEYNSR